MRAEMPYHVRNPAAVDLDEVSLVENQALDGVVLPHEELPHLVVHDLEGPVVVPASEDCLSGLQHGVDGPVELPDLRRQVCETRVLLYAAPPRELTDKDRQGGG